MPPTSLRAGQMEAQRRLAHTDPRTKAFIGDQSLIITSFDAMRESATTKV